MPSGGRLCPFLSLMTEPVPASGGGTGDSEQPLPHGVLWSLHSELSAGHRGPSGPGKQKQTTVPVSDGRTDGLRGRWERIRREWPPPAAITLAPGSRDAVPRLPGLEAKDVLLLLSCCKQELSPRLFRAPHLVFPRAVRWQRGLEMQLTEAACYHGLFPRVALSLNPRGKWLV